MALDHGMQACPDCDGQGYCDECDGSGDAACPCCGAETMTCETCETCEGSGNCLTCGGEGQVEIETDDQ